MIVCPGCGRLIDPKADLLKGELTCAGSSPESGLTSFQSAAMAKPPAETEDWGEYETLEIQREGASLVEELF